MSGEMEARILTGLLQRGMAPHIAQGVMANMIAESRLDPGINEIAPLVPGSRGGFGLNQWTGPRRRALEAAAAQRGVPVSDLDFQLDFTMQELQGPEVRAWRALQAAPDAVSAARVFSEQFLRPGIPHLQNRLRHAARLAGQPMPQVPADAGGAGADPPALAGLFATAPEPPRLGDLLPMRRRATAQDEEAEQTRRRRQALFGAGGLADIYG